MGVLSDAKKVGVFLRDPLDRPRDDWQVVESGCAGPGGNGRAKALGVVTVEQKGDSQMDHRAKAEKLMRKYLRRANMGAGLPWDKKKDAESDALVDHLIRAAAAEASCHHGYGPAQ